MTGPVGWIGKGAGGEDGRELGAAMGEQSCLFLAPSEAGQGSVQAEFWVFAVGSSL